MTRGISHLKIARMAAGLSQAELGRQIGYSQITVSRLERGEHVRLLPGVARHISELLGVPETDLFKDSPPRRAR